MRTPNLKLSSSNLPNQQETRTMATVNKLGGTFTFPGTSITVNRMGYGAMQLAGPHVFGPPKDRNAAIAVLREAIKTGINHIDTSDFYGPHITNGIIKEALQPYPDGLTIVTKVGARRDDKGAWLPAQTPAELESAVYDNLRNLGLDALDVVNYRAWTGMEGPKEQPLEEQFRTLAKLQEKGLIRHLGLSTVTANQIKAAREIAPVVCIQNEYNLVQRRDDALIDMLAADGIAYVSYFPLGGFTPLQSSVLNDAATALGTTPMVVALAWQLHRAPNMLLIPGTSSVGHLRENISAASLQIPPELMEKLNGIASHAG
jgi:pyridoxine 4-dehydrogenase